MMLPAVPITRPALPPVLKQCPISAHDRHRAAVRRDRARLGLMLLFAAVALLVALMADFTDEAWPVAVLVALPFAALLLERRLVAPAPRRIRPPKHLIDRRPVLLRPILVVPEGRSPRIVRALPRRLTHAAMTRAALPPRRPSRIAPRHRSN